MDSSQSASAKQSQTSRPSSFLDGFLSDTPEPAPYVSAPEDAKISDRSAFDKQNFSIEEIVTGSGVSNMANFPTIQPAAASRTRPPMPSRESAIPLTPPKKFKGHSLTSFPDKPQQRLAATSIPTPRKRQIQPTTYTTGTFSSFRTFSTSRYWQTRRNLSTTSCLRQSPHQKQPAATPPPQRNVHRPPQTTTPTERSRPQLVKPGPRPTELSPKQLLANKEFRALRRRWTAIIVGLPFLIVTSWLLYKRLDEFDRGEEILGPRERVRERGVLPGFEKGNIGKS